MLLKEYELLDVLFKLRFSLVFYLYCADTCSIADLLFFYLHGGALHCGILPVYFSLDPQYYLYALGVLHSSENVQL